MNALATELNTILAGTVVERMLSDFGKRIYFPKGIVAQSAEASKRAHRFNATAGMAFTGGEPIMLPSLRTFVQQLTPKEAVAYAPTGGIAELREIWGQEMRAKNPGLRGLRTSVPLVVPGLTNGVFQAASLFANPDDVVLIPDMFWGNYRLIFEEQKRAKIVPFPFFADRPFSGSGRLNLEALETALNANAARGKIIILLNFPNNPTGYSPTTSEAARIVEIITGAADRGCDILVVTDDAYFGLFYENDTFRESIFTPLAGAHDRVLAMKVDGATKEEFVWGFRIGFITFGSKGLSETHYAALEKKVMGAVRSTISNSSTLAQNLLIHAMRAPNYPEEKRAELANLKKRYRTVRGIVEKSTPTDILEPLPFNSGYFMSFRCRGVSAEAIRLTLLDEGIGIISIGDEFVRIAFSSVDESNLDELYAAIFTAAKRVAGN